MLQNAYFLAKIGADTAENEQHVAEILPKTGNYPTGPSRARRGIRPGGTAQVFREGRPLRRHGRAASGAQLSVHIKFHYIPVATALHIHELRTLKLRLRKVRRVA